jgi:Uma2 family endonuclease
MPTLLTDAPEMPLPLAPPRKRWTREQCAPLEASGLFEIEKLELVDGELISKMGKNLPHAKASSRFQRWLVRTFDWNRVNVEMAIDVSPADNPTNEPQPDLIVLKRDLSTFDSNPQPQDLDLVVEIADSTLKFDLTTKAALYARAGIADYWVFDVAGKRLYVHRSPVSGRYSSVAVYSQDEAIAPLAAPDSPFRLSEAFGK